MVDNCHWYSGTLVLLKMCKLGHFGVPVFTNYVYFTTHQRPPRLLRPPSEMVSLKRFHCIGNLIVEMRRSSTVLAQQREFLNQYDCIFILRQGHSLIEPSHYPGWYWARLAGWSLHFLLHVVNILCRYCTKFGATELQ